MKRGIQETTQSGTPNAKVAKKNQPQQTSTPPPKRAMSPQAPRPKQSASPAPRRAVTPTEAMLAEPPARIDRAVTPEFSRSRELTAADETAPTATATATATGEEISKFRVSRENVEQLSRRGISTFFPIQSATFDHIFDGKDLVGRAQTGSGKTLSFVLPTVERMCAGDPKPRWTERARLPRVLCIAPTRELARQDAEEFEKCVAHVQGATVVLVYGGAPIGPQVNALWRGADIVVGTPGRLIDLIDRKALDLTALKHFILDEADEMLSFGFAEDVEKVLLTAPKGDSAPQTLLFSATMPEWVKSIANKFLRPDHVNVDLLAGQSRGTKVPEGVRHLALCCSKSATADVLRNVLQVCTEGLTPESRTIVFCQTKHEADSLLTKLSATVSCQVIHGDVSQSQREAALRDFRAGKFSTLVATDVAARGLDISGVDRVVMCQPPKDSEIYIHRAGRTGRAGRGGMAITLYQREEAGKLHHIECKAGMKFQRIGAPQPSSLVRLAMDSVKTQLAEVPSEVAASLTKDAEAVAEANGGPMVALAKALAKLARVGAAADSHSLLGGVQGFVTLMMRTRGPMAHKGVALGYLRRWLPEGLSPRECTMVDGGAVFDIPHWAAQEMLAKRTHGDVVGFEAIDVLPDGVTIPAIEDVRGYGAKFGGSSGSRSGGGSFGGQRPFSGGSNMRVGNRFGSSNPAAGGQQFRQPNRFGGNNGRRF